MKIGLYIRTDRGVNADLTELTPEELLKWLNRMDDAEARRWIHRIVSVVRGPAEVQDHQADRVKEKMRAELRREASTEA